MRTVGEATGTKTTVQPAGSVGGVVDEHTVEECTVAAHNGPRNIHYYPVNNALNYPADTNNNHDHHRNLETGDRLGNHTNDDHSWTKCKSL